MFLVSLVLLALSTCNGHVVLDYPFPRTNNDYLFSFDADVCNPDDETCGAFCGDPFDTPNAPVTVLPVGMPVLMRWQTTVIHPPFQYRIAVNPIPGGDANFDANIQTTVSNADARVGATIDDSRPATGQFTAPVTFPVSLLDTCNNNESEQQPPCVVQLYDLYYFVSCANVRFTADPSQVTPLTRGEDVELPVVEIESTVQENEPLVDEGGLEQPPPFEQTATTTTTSRAACKETVILATVAVILSVFSYV